MEQTCPYCGGALQSGFVQAGQRVFWAREEQRFWRIPNKKDGEFYLRGYDLWEGSACPGRYCPTCKLIYLPQKENEE